MGHGLTMAMLVITRGYIIGSYQIVYPLTLKRGNREIPFSMEVVMGDHL